MDGTGKSYTSALGLFWWIYNPRDILWEQILDFHKLEMEKRSVVFNFKQSGYNEPFLPAAIWLKYAMSLQTHS